MAEKRRVKVERVHCNQCRQRTEHRLLKKDRFLVSG